MFIRKKKLIKEIDAMIGDLYYYQQLWSRVDTEDAKRRVDCFEFAITEMESLRYFLKYGDHTRRIHRR